ncbi:hypothetical protein PR003_g7195 [Phytophthora rubi]|uniref:Helitron helicase-like domain-containing protein n=1 Tax=Phytophthora rubi TaxID=129364 RepID=A0A6A3NA99_9STRA|nr:hypothetical protein PR001_g6713 [Phytophthora rubi]KAE9346929.1 hypothetical protein PR003_g7195 [Phytophthora rubi]
MFLNLFPFGRGHLGEDCHVSVSMDACLGHYAELITRKFAEDDLFTVVSFDHLTVQKLFTSMAFKCQRAPGRFATFSDVTEQALLNALKTKELRRQRRISSARGGGGDTGASAADMLNTVELSDSLVMAQYCGVLSVDSLFDAKLAEPPGESARHSASMRNDVASARLFTRNIDAFIEHVVGVLLKHMKGQSFDGLFGKVKAYCRMVETQGGGTLHAHFLAWLVDAPPNSDHRDDVDAIERRDSSCVFCSHSYADLEELSIPSEAYEGPKKHHGPPRGEPELVRCSRCGDNLSSQHVIRLVLLDSRPASWPPSLRPYTSVELEDAVQLEARHRGGIRAAKAAIYRRDLCLSTREHEAPIKALPPSPDDARWPARCVAFAVSMLLFMLNLHWWSHAGAASRKAAPRLPGSAATIFLGRARRARRALATVSR